MAAVSGDYFSIGSVIWCRTCYNSEIEGEVMAFDAPTKMLALKSPSTSGNAGLRDVTFINLSLVSELQVKREVTTVPDQPLTLNLQQISGRVRNQVDAKRQLLSNMSTTVTPEGQRLFIALAKTIKEVRWRDNDIVVWDDNVSITPPYQVENVRGNVNSKDFKYICKIVERHINETMTPVAGVATSGTAPTTTPTSTTTSLSSQPQQQQIVSQNTQQHQQ